jgi:signal peptidase I
MLGLAVALQGRHLAHGVLRPCLISAATSRSRLQSSPIRSYTSETPSPQPGSSQSQGSSKGGPSARQIISGLLWIPVAVYFLNNFYTIAQVEGGSMSPSMAPDINRKDIVLLNKYAASTENIFMGNGLLSVLFPGHSATHRQDLHIGDVIFFISPLDPRQRCTKRILAMPGDIVSTTLGHTPASSTSAKPSAVIRIPPGHIWVEGDASASEYKEGDDQNPRIEVPSNRKSRDSRTYGPVSGRTICECAMVAQNE